MNAKTAYAVVNCYGHEWGRYAYRDMAQGVAERCDRDPAVRAWYPYTVVPVEPDAPRLEGWPK